MQKRLCGREQEFGLSVFPMPRCLGGDSESSDEFFPEISQILLKRLAKKYDSIGVEERIDTRPTGDNHFSDSNFWFVSGCRAYLDVNTLEICTPEHLPCSLDSVLYEKATEIMLNNVIEKPVLWRDIWRHVSIYKNNIAYELKDGLMIESTYGSHQNYSCKRRAIKNVSNILQSFLPASLPLTGSGHVLFSGSKPTYCFSQRADHIHAEMNDNTGNGARPLVNIKGFKGQDTLVRDGVGLARVHLISLDATRCEFQTWLVEGILHLVLRLAEEGWHVPNGDRLDRPVTSIKDLNLALDCRHKLLTKSGRQISTIKYLKMFLSAARQLKPLSISEKACLSEWENVLDLLKDPEASGLVGKLDWVTKLNLLNNQMKKYDFNLRDGRAIRINMEYHNISNDPKKSMFAYLQEAGYIHRISTDKAVKSAIHNAPMTRARARGEFIRQCLLDKRRKNKIGGIAWGDAFWEGKRITFGLGGDPFSTKLD